MTTATAPAPLQNRDLKAAARRLYADASSAARLIQSLRPYICPFNRLLEFIPAGSRVLDIGCGSGLLLAIAADTRALGPCIGFDSNRKAIAVAELAAKRLAADGKSVPQFVRLDVRDPWPKGTFDVVAMIDVLHHVPVVAQQSAIQQAVAAVPPGGTFMYKDIAPRPRWRAGMNRLHDLVMVREWVHYVYAEKVVEWATAGGLTLRRREWIPQLWYGHDMLVFDRLA
jgi:2-polyprenyl-3-methyl-5-hydroxy-6-metoxy-1,4-benzoquinol methylase